MPGARPFMDIRFRGRTAVAVLDSGAAISYPPDGVARGVVGSEEYLDFYPGYGEFSTQLGRVTIETGGEEVLLGVVVLPEDLRQELSKILKPDEWIVGTDWFRDRVTVVDLANGWAARGRALER